MTNRFQYAGAWIFLASLLPTCLSGCGSAQGFDSPEECCLEIKTSIEKKDMGGFYDCLTEESQDVVAGSMVMMKMMSGMAAAMGGPEAAKDFAEIDAALEKHGVTKEAFEKAAPDRQQLKDPDAVKDLAVVVKDKRAFVVDMFAAMEKSGKVANLRDKLNGELKDLKIEGDKATATLETPQGDEELDFRKTANGWKLHIDLQKLAAKAGPAPNAGFSEEPQAPPLPPTGLSAEDDGPDAGATN